jgi:ribosomal protein S18 acetylase RimI-like enzyme
VIRPGTPEDAEAVARVHIATWQVAYAGILPQEGLDQLSGEPAARQVKFHRSFPPIVAEADGEIVGFVSVGRANDEDADGELYAIYVHPDHWDRGFGRDLLLAGEERLRELGHEHAVLWVLEANPRARRFYELGGWTLDGTRRPIEVFGVEVPEVRYEKRLVA